MTPATAVPVRSLKSVMGCKGENNTIKIMESIEQKIKKIEERNERVEVDKAWEESWTRRILLMLFTYLAIGAYLWIIDLPGPWLNAVIPAVAFMLSTLTMPFFKELWLRRKNR